MKLKWKGWPAQRLAGAGALDDQPVVLGPPVLGEIEDVLAEVVAQREVGVDDEHLVFLALRLRDDLPAGRDDGGAADHVEAVFGPALGRSRDPHRVLVGRGLQRQQVAGHAQVRRLAPVDVPARRVVAQHGELGALQAHHAEGLGPAPVVADAHADPRAERLPDLEALIANLEVLLLQVLERRLGLVVRMAGQMDLAVAADDVRLVVHQYGGVEAPAVLRELSVAQIEADAQLAREVEERLRLGARHGGLEETLGDLRVG